MLETRNNKTLGKVSRTWGKFQRDSTRYKVSCVVDECTRCSAVGVAGRDRGFDVSGWMRRIPQNVLASLGWEVALKG